MRCSVVSGTAPLCGLSPISDTSLHLEHLEGPSTCHSQSNQIKSNKHVFHIFPPTFHASTERSCCSCASNTWQKHVTSGSQLFWTSNCSRSEWACQCTQSIRQTICLDLHRLQDYAQQADSQLPTISNQLLAINGSSMVSKMTQLQKLCLCHWWDCLDRSRSSEKNWWQSWPLEAGLTGKILEDHQPQPEKQQTEWVNFESGFHV